MLTRPLAGESVTYVLRRLPRPCRRRKRITVLLTDEFGISQSFAKHASNGFYEAALVVVFPFVESESLLIAIPEQMKRLDVNVGAFKGALQEAPEVLQTVSVNQSVCVAFQMVNDLVEIISLHAVIRVQRVCVEIGAFLYDLA